MSTIFYDLSDLNKIAENIVTCSRYKVVCFYGSMGVGKTTLIKQLLIILGAKDKGNSPTFGIVNEYRTANEELVAYHFDCYRLESLEEAYDLGIEEYLQANCWIFIEWPENISGLLPAQRTEIRMRIKNSNTRELSIHNLAG